MSCRQPWIPKLTWWLALSSSGSSLALNQKQLAAAIGIDPASMNRVEKGERAVSVVELVRLATVLDVRVEELLAPTAPAPSIWLRASGESSAAVSESLSLFRDVIRDFFGARATVG